MTLQLARINSSTGAVVPYDPSFDEQLEAGREFMKEYRETFKALAQ